MENIPFLALRASRFVFQPGQTRKASVSASWRRFLGGHKVAHGRPVTLRGDDLGLVMRIMYIMLNAVQTFILLMNLTGPSLLEVAGP